MSTYSAGKFSVSIHGPHPVWITLLYDGEQLPHIRHDELRDLEYVIARAMSEAKVRLGERHANEL